MSMIEKQDAKKYQGKPVFIRKVDGYNKFGIVSFVSECFLTLNYFNGKVVNILFTDILSIDPYKEPQPHAPQLIGKRFRQEQFKRRRNYG